MIPSHFKVYTKQDLLSLVKLRRFETKLGERIHAATTGSSLHNLVSSISTRYVVFGIPEDIGILANYGKGGADSAWVPFLQAFFNMQSNDLFNGDDITVLGHFDFGDIKYLIERNAHDGEERIEALRHAVTTIDDEVEALVKAIVAAGKFPIVVGGGHNNAYPMIKGVAKALDHSSHGAQHLIHCINLDAHSDFRPSEGRHSGNGFRYAMEDGFLKKYFILGIQESYTPQNLLLDLNNNPDIQFISYEDLYLKSTYDFRQGLAQAIDFTSDRPCGVEIDLDVIQNVLSSAQTPAGFSATEARQFAYTCGTAAQACYLHVCEGATRLSNGQSDESTGKLIALLTADFLRAHQDQD